jgi:glycosyltransferase involved in cell wall biosynthesis
MTDRDALRVLLLSHGHPQLSLGGGEVASYNLHKGLKAEGAASFYLARTAAPVPRHGTSALLGYGLPQDEILYHADDYDHFRLSNGNTDEIQRDLVRVVVGHRPDVVHFHHVIGFGLETIHAIRQALPDATLVMTIHEYLALCHHHGQMVKRSNGSLCQRGSPIDCHLCFPELSPAQFLRRDRLIAATYGLIDHFVSPSRFLAERYVKWGLPAEKMSVIENGLDIPELAPPRLLTGPEPRRARFAFFGQMIPLKGIDVLLDAVTRVPEDVWGDDARVMIFGSNLDRQTPSYRARVEELLTAAGPKARIYGAYQNSEMPRLMRSVDWVVVPSTWWENSPVVIQEAFFHGRPAIVGNIGGMAEKVRDRVDGLHFRAGSAEDLADRFIEALTTPTLWERLRAGIVRPPSHVDCAGLHLDLYRRLLEHRPTTGAAGQGRVASIA